MGILSSNVTLTAVNGGTANFTKSVSNASGTNTVNVTGAGTGTVVFNSATANAFAPTAISISSGTLLLGAGEQIADTTNLTLNGGTFSMAGLTGATETLGALTLSANSTIDFGSGNSDTLRFSSLNLAGFSLSIKGWTGSYYSASETTDHGPSTQDRLLFSSDAATGNSLGAISFYSDAGNLIGTAKEVSYGSGGAYSFEVVPVPEPATWMAGAALLGLVGYRERRRFRRAATVS